MTLKSIRYRIKKLLPLAQLVSSEAGRFKLEALGYLNNRVLPGSQIDSVGI